MDSVGEAVSYDIIGFVFGCMLFTAEPVGDWKLFYILMGGLI